MNAPKSPDTPETWDAASKGYSEHVAPVMMASFASEFVDRLDVNDGTEALEVAAGSGAITETLAKRVKSLLATDFSPQMLEILRKRLATANNVRFALMDGQALQLEDASFDRAACCFGLMLFPDRAKGFAELRRVLRPGGRAVVAGWAGPDKFEAFGIFLAAMQKAFPDMPPPPAPPPVFTLADPADFKRQMEAGGFRDVSVELVPREVEVASVDQIWAMLTSGAPPVQMLLDRVGEAGKSKLRDALQEVVQARFGSGPLKFTNQATLGTGVRAA